MSVYSNPYRTSVLSKINCSANGADYEMLNPKGEEKRMTKEPVEIQKEPPVETHVEKSMRELRVLLLAATDEITSLKATQGDLAKDLKDANDVIDDDAKSKLIHELTKTTTHPIADLIGMDTARLQQLRDDQKMLKVRTLVAGVDMPKLEGDGYEPIREIYGQYKYTKGGKL